MDLCDKASKLFLAASSLSGPALFRITGGCDEQSIIKKMTVHQKGWDSQGNKTSEFYHPFCFYSGFSEIRIFQKLKRVHAVVQVSFN